jgi:tetratricopeptide (TPR) repeat protein
MMRRLLLTACITMLTLGATAQGSLEKGLNADSKGLNDLAVGYYREAVDTNAQARLHLGLLLQRMEHFAEAAHWLGKADSSATAMCHLAECLCEQRDWEGAKKAAEKAIELSAPADSALRASAMASLAMVYCVDESYTNASTWAHKAQAEDPKSARALNVTGIIYFYKGNDNEATQTFRKAIQSDPKNIDAYFNLGTMYCYRNSYDMAINTLKKGLKLERNSIKLIYCLGWAYLLKGEKENAIECLETVIK